MKSNFLVAFSYNSGAEKVTVYVNGEALAFSSTDTDAAATGADWESTAVFKLGDCRDPKSCPDVSLSAFRVLTYARTAVEASEFKGLYTRTGAVPFAYKPDKAPQMCLRPLEAPVFTFDFGTQAKVREMLGKGFMLCLRHARFWVSFLGSFVWMVLVIWL